VIGSFIFGDIETVLISSISGTIAGASDLHRPSAKVRRIGESRYIEFPSYSLPSGISEFVEDFLFSFSQDCFMLHTFSLASLCFSGSPTVSLNALRERGPTLLSIAEPQEFDFPSYSLPLSVIDFTVCFLDSALTSAPLDSVSGLFVGCIHK
jgi:hypothetical protein